MKRKQALSAEVIDCLNGNAGGDYLRTSNYLKIHIAAAAGPVAQWIRHRPTEPGIAGSSPAGVIFSTSALRAVLLLKLFDLHAIFSSPIPCSLFLFSFSVAFIFGFCWNLCIGMPGYLCFSLRFLQEKKGERERERCKH